MKAAVIDEAGAAPRYGDFAEPEAQEGREVVEVVAAGIHPVVRSLASGRHYGSSQIWPQVPGVDAVARTAAGTLVYTGYPQAPWGTFADRLSAPSGGLRLPGGADPAQIAGGVNPGMASWMPLASTAARRPLRTVLVLGATGVAGLLAVQNARILGAENIVAVARNPDGLRRATELGATATARLTGDRETDAADMQRALDGRAPEVVLDLLWGAPAEAALQALNRRGLDEDTADIDYTQIGSVAGAEARVPSVLLRSRKIRILGRGSGANSISEIMEQLPRFMQLIGDGAVAVPIQTFPLSRIADAWAASGTGGRRVVVMP